MVLGQLKRVEKFVLASQTSQVKQKMDLDTLNKGSAVDWKNVFDLNKVIIKLFLNAPQ
jgi:hypothetical protein